MLYAYTSKELYIFCSSKVMRYKVLCFGVLLLLLRVLLPRCCLAAAAATLHRLVCVYSYDFSGGGDYLRF